MDESILKIDLENPISYGEVEKMIQAVLKVAQPACLLVDFGDHNFESLEVLKFCKEELSAIESRLLKFNKIAFLTIPRYNDGRQDSEKLKYFYSENKANEWLLSEN